MEPLSLIFPRVGFGDGGDTGDADGADSGCSAAQRVPYLLCPTAHSLLPELSQAETGAEFAEQSVVKLEKTIDDLEGKTSSLAHWHSFLGSTGQDVPPLGLDWAWLDTWIDSTTR